MTAAETGFDFSWPRRKSMPKKIGTTLSTISEGLSTNVPANRKTTSLKKLHTASHGKHTTISWKKYNWDEKHPIKQTQKKQHTQTSKRGNISTEKSKPTTHPSVKPPDHHFYQALDMDSFSEETSVEPADINSEEEEDTEPMLNQMEEAPESGDFSYDLNPQNENEDMEPASTELEESMIEETFDQNISTNKNDEDMFEVTREIPGEVPELESQQKNKLFHLNDELLQNSDLSTELQEENGATINKIENQETEVPTFTEFDESNKPTGINQDISNTEFELTTPVEFEETTEMVSDEVGALSSSSAKESPLQYLEADEQTTAESVSPENENMLFGTLHEIGDEESEKLLSTADFLLDNNNKNLGATFRTITSGEQFDEAATPADNTENLQVAKSTGVFSMLAERSTSTKQTQSSISTEEEKELHSRSSTMTGVMSKETSEETSPTNQEYIETSSSGQSTPNQKETNSHPSSVFINDGTSEELFSSHPTSFGESTTNQENTSEITYEQEFSGGTEETNELLQTTDTSPLVNTETTSKPKETSKGIGKTTTLNKIEGPIETTSEGKHLSGKNVTESLEEFLSRVEPPEIPEYDENGTISEISTIVSVTQKYETRTSNMTIPNGIPSIERITILLTEPTEFVTTENIKLIAGSSTTQTKGSKIPEGSTFSEGPGNLTHGTLLAEEISSPMRTAEASETPKYDTVLTSKAYGSTGESTSTTELENQNTEVKGTTPERSIVPVEKILTESWASTQTTEEMFEKTSEEMQVSSHGESSPAEPILETSTTISMKTAKTEMNELKVTTNGPEQILTLTPTSTERLIPQTALGSPESTENEIPKEESNTSQISSNYISSETTEGLIVGEVTKEVQESVTETEISANIENLVSTIPETVTQTLTKLRITTEVTYNQTLATNAESTPASKTTESEMFTEMAASKPSEEFETQTLPTPQVIFQLPTEVKPTTEETYNPPIGNNVSNVSLEGETKSTSIIGEETITYVPIETTETVLSEVTHKPPNELSSFSLLTNTFKKLESTSEIAQSETPKVTSTEMEYLTPTEELKRETGGPISTTGKEVELPTQVTETAEVSFFSSLGISSSSSSTETSSEEESTEIEQNIKHKTEASQKILTIEPETTEQASTLISSTESTKSGLLNTAEMGHQMPAETSLEEVGVTVINTSEEISTAVFSTFTTEVETPTELISSTEVFNVLPNIISSFPSSTETSRETELTSSVQFEGKYGEITKETTLKQEEDSLTSTLTFIETLETSEHLSTPTSEITETETTEQVSTYASTFSTLRSLPTESTQSVLTTTETGLQMPAETSVEQVGVTVINTSEEISTTESSTFTTEVETPTKLILSNVSPNINSSFPLSTQTSRETELTSSVQFEGKYEEITKETMPKHEEASLTPTLSSIETLETTEHLSSPTSEIIETEITKQVSMYASTFSTLQSLPTESTQSVLTTTETGIQMPAETSVEQVGVTVINTSEEISTRESSTFTTEEETPTKLISSTEVFNVSPNIISSFPLSSETSRETELTSNVQFEEKYVEITTTSKHEEASLTPTLSFMEASETNEHLSAHTSEITETKTTEQASRYASTFSTLRSPPTESTQSVLTTTETGIQMPAEISVEQVGVTVINTSEEISTRESSTFTTEEETPIKLISSTEVFNVSPNIISSSPLSSETSRETELTSNVQFEEKYVEITTTSKHEEASLTPTLSFMEASETNEHLSAHTSEITETKTTEQASRYASTFSTLRSPPTESTQSVLTTTETGIQMPAETSVEQVGVTVINTSEEISTTESFTFTTEVETPTQLISSTEVSNVSLNIISSSPLSTETSRETELTSNVQFKGEYEEITKETTPEHEEASLTPASSFMETLETTEHLSTPTSEITETEITKKASMYASIFSTLRSLSTESTESVLTTTETGVQMPVETTEITHAVEGGKVPIVSEEIQSSVFTTSIPTLGDVGITASSSNVTETELISNENQGETVSFGKSESSTFSTSQLTILSLNQVNVNAENLNETESISVTETAEMAESHSTLTTIQFSTEEPLGKEIRKS
ncbi:hypothetical protein JTB14_026402 [Gonioctena quinquepunctata]|nr:hypothetical protein JTB14_026402 [Gonioctena quinquepunctata]